MEDIKMKNIKILRSNNLTKLTYFNYKYTLTN